MRVRLLVDDLNTSGEDRRFMHLGQHPNVEVRVFNPFPGGRSAIWSRILTSISDIPRINHRMHNKLFVADNALAITGGRNIGDEYFTLDKHSNFIDLDLVGAGPIVPQLSASFDAFWNSKYAYPIASLADPTPAAPRRGAAGPGARGSRRSRRRRASPRRTPTGCGASSMRTLLKLDLGARHRARGPAGQDRERCISRSGRDHREQHRGAHALRATGDPRDLAVLRAGQGGRRADARARRARRAHPHPHQLARLDRRAARA